MIIIPVVVAIGVGLVGLFLVSGSSLGGNQMLLHSHVRLNVTVNEQPMIVPAHIGMVQVGKAEDPLLYGNHSIDQYGMEGMSPLHTHDETGTIHVESNIVRNYTLGELLDIWKELNIDGKTVIVTVNDKPVSDFRNLILNDGERIKLDVTS